MGSPEDYKKDMAAIGEDEMTRKWWKVTMLERYRA